MKEINIKQSLVKKLVCEGGVEAIASEFSFDFGRRRADLILIKSDEVYGYEIKSAFDTLLNLSAQITSYCLIFDFVYVVCDVKHLAQVRTLVPAKVGLYVCNLDKVRLVRKAKKINRFDSLVMLDAMPVNHLRSEFGIAAKSKYELCQKVAAGYQASLIRRALLNYLILKYGIQTELFHKEISSVVTLDDVYFLFLPAANKLDI